MSTTPHTPTDTDRRPRDDDPLRLTTENLHRLNDTDLSRVVGGGRILYTRDKPSFR